MSPRGRRGNGARSEDDRQRARLEREQRRARREGRPVPRSVDDLPVGEPGGDPQDLGLDPRTSDLAADRHEPTASAATPDVRPADEPTPAGPAGRRERLDAIRRPTEQPGAGPGHERSASAPDPASGRSAPGPDRPGSASSSPWWAQGPGGGAAPPPPAGDPPARGPVASRDPGGASPPAASGRPADGRDVRRPASDAAPAARRPAPPGHGAPVDRPRETPRAPGSPDPRSSEDRDAPLWAPGAGAGDGRTAGARPGDRGRADADDWFGPDETDEHTAEPRPEPAERAAPALVPLRPAGPARASGTAPATVHTRTAPARRGVSRIAALLVLVPFVVVVAAAVFLFQPFAGEGEGEVRVKIEPGSSVDDIGRLLKEKGVVSNSLAFAIRARISGDGANLKAGTLRLKRDMSYGAALTALQQDPLPPSVIRVAIPEGLSRREASSTVRRAGITGSYLSASARASGFDPTDYGQPRSRKGLEGFLFPATYELQRGGATAKDLVAEQLKSFRTNIAKVSMTRARRAKLSRYDVLIIASMIEREVRIPSERRLVSAVIWNRLKDGTPLGIDATTRYAVRNWDRPLKQSEIDSKTPYDTRYRKGLPPTPIGSPGLAAMRAAANPANVSYLWYVVRPCSDGAHAFASTNDKFLKDREAYNAAQRRAGGDPSPSDAKGCKG